MNLRMKGFDAVCLAMIFFCAPLAGCFGSEGDESQEMENHWLPPVEDRHGKEYRTDDVFSRVSWNGTYEIDLVRSIYVEIPEIDASDGGAGVTGGAEVHLGLWMPVIEGCNWDSLEVSEECKIPVITEIGPYYDDGDVDALTPADRLGRFLIENFVPHGFGVAQVSVFGTGNSNHCMDLMGYDEQAGIKGAIDWLGMQNWSNGRVAAIGKSYDGSTPWNAAASGSKFLTTIVPMSGLIGMHDLMWRNGSMEARGAIMHNGVYGSFGLDGDSGDIENACEGYLEGYYAGPAAYMTGDNLGWLGSDYWEERHFLSGALENYQGSIYIIHGLQDWNVDPHMAFPTHQRAVDAGFDVKGLYGQWAHDYPDRESGHSSLSSGRGEEAYPYTLRWDWGDDLLEWFDFYLRDIGPQPRLIAEVQDNMGGWRVESTYPPEDLEWIMIGMDQCDYFGNTVIGSNSQSHFVCPDFLNDTRIVGTPTFHIEAQISLFSTSGHLFVEMQRSSDGLHLGHAVMDLRFHSGGNEGEILAPGSTVIAKMEFFGMDVIVPAGDGISLFLSQTGEDYVPSPVSTAPVTISTDASSILGLSTVDRTCLDLFLPPMVQNYQFCNG